MLIIDCHGHYTTAPAQLQTFRDVQLARRFESFSLPRWSANDDYEDLIRATLRNLPLRQPSILTVKSLRRILNVSDGLTAKIFSMLNALAIAAIEKRNERITDEAVLLWAPAVKPEPTYS